MLLFSMIEKAKRLAEFAHFEQKYGDKDYFDYHVKGVVNNAQSIAGNLVKDTTMLAVVAYLHDVVEDSSVTIEMVEESFGQEVADNVKALTYDATSSRTAYIENFLIVKDRLPYAWYVKVADTMFNLGESVIGNDSKKVLKYSTQLAKLHGGK